MALAPIRRIQVLSVMVGMEVCVSVEVVQDDCREFLKWLPAASFDSCITDPPYELKFMGKRWDGTRVAFEPETWAAVFRLLKPGAHLLAFGGTRTYHRMACAIEDAGFEIRDQIGWAYGTGFPKSHDVSKGIDKAAGAEREKIKKEGAPAYQRSIGNTRPWMNDPDHMIDGDEPATDAARQWQGWGTALKPAWEPIVLARKPLIGTVAANVLAHGTGALNIDGCRVACDEKTPFPVGANSIDGVITTGLHSKPRSDDTSKNGRWPANLIHDGSDEVLAAFPESKGQQGDLVGHSKDRKSKGIYGDLPAARDAIARGDSGSAARFFYCVKASTKEREGSKHPTVKPIALMEYLVRLVTPPGGTVLDPFAGSGTTGVACKRQGFHALLVEREAEYVADIERRLAA